MILPLETGVHFGYIKNFTCSPGKYLKSIRMIVSSESHTFSILYANHITFPYSRFTLFNDEECDLPMDDVTKLLNERLAGRECLMDVELINDHDVFFNYVGKFCIL